MRGPITRLLRSLWHQELQEGVARNGSRRSSRRFATGSGQHRFQLEMLEDRRLLSSVPTITIDDVQQLEGDDATSIVFTVTRSGKSNQASTVDYTTVGSSATAGEDYESASGTLEFAPGEKTKTIGVTVKGDLDSEPDEEFFVNLSNPTNAKIGDDQGLATIENDDFGPALPTISIDDVQQVEGDSGTTSFVFTVTRSGDTSGTSSIDYQTADGTATLADNDYAALPVTVLNFAANETTKTITVDVTGDTVAEPNETFFVNLSNPAGADCRR